MRQGQLPSNYRRLLYSVKPYLVYLIIGIVGTLFVSGVDSFFAWLIKPIINEVFIQRQSEWVSYIPLIMFGLFLLRGVSTFISTYFISRCSRFVVMDFRQRIFQHFLVLPVKFFSRKKSGDLVSLLVYNVDQISDASSQTIVNAIQDFALVVGLLTTMFFISWQLSSCLLIIGPLMYLLMRFVSKRTRALSHWVQGSVADLIAVTQETLRAMVLIRLHGTQKLELSRFYRVIKTNRQQSLKVSVTSALSSSVVQCLLAIPVSLVLFLATQSWIEVTAGAFASLLTAMVMIIKPIRRLSSTNAAIARGLAGADSIFSLLDEPAEQDTGSMIASNVSGLWEIKNLTFRYEPDSVVLNDLSFAVKSGTMVGIVGESGSGKSTLIKLLAGLYQDYEGELLINGVPISSYTLDSFRQQVSYVAQDSVVFDSTIADNVSYGDAQQDMARILLSLEQAQLLDWVNGLESGVATRVGELGSRLSGGQRQRLALARAIYRKSPIVILDEATSSLDYQTESRLQAAIHDLRATSTLFVVAHRLSTIEGADNILVMRDGRLLEQGTHGELMQKKSFYCDLYENRFNEQVKDDASV